MKNLIAILSLASILLVGCNALTTNTNINGNTNEDGESMEDKDDSTMMRVGDNAIYVAAQPYGTTLTVTQAVLKDGGYVVIHQVTDDGKPGSIVASSDLLGSGESKNVEITVPELITAPTELIAMLHTDDGDGEFDASKDAAVKGEDGNVIMMKFDIDEDAELPSEISL